jgi:hypothetical protein
VATKLNRLARSLAAARDIADEPLPLLTAGKNGAVAAGVLWEAAEVLVGDRPPEALPEGVRHDLWEIANRSPEVALAVWSRLSVADASSDDAAWRSAIAHDARFMALASDLARNFLVLVPLTTQPLQRRVIKFAYDEQISMPSQSRRPSREFIAGYRQWRRRLRQGAGLGRDGAGVLRVQAAERSGPGGEQEPLSGVLIEVGRPDGTIVDEQATDADGQVFFQLPVGEYMVRECGPHTLAAAGPTSYRAVVLENAWPVVRFSHHRLAPLAAAYGAEAPLPDRRLRLARWLGRRSERVVILLPAIGQAASFHVEFEAPDGLKVTTARLESRPATAQPDDPEGADGRPDVQLLAVQRAHLYKSAVPPGHSGTAVVHIRPRAEMIIRAGTIAAFVVLILIAAVGFNLSGVGANPDAAAAVLLLIPGGLSAWVARPREHPATISLVFRLRLVASTAGLWGIIGAVLIVVSQRWRRATATAAVQYLGPRPYLSYAFELLMALSVASFVVMGLAWLNAERPPEQRKWAERVADLNRQRELSAVANIET